MSTGRVFSVRPTGDNLCLGQIWPSKTFWHRSETYRGEIFHLCSEGGRVQTDFLKRVVLVINFFLSCVRLSIGGVTHQISTDYLFLACTQLPDEAQHTNCFHVGSPGSPSSIIYPQEMQVVSGQGLPLGTLIFCLLTKTFRNP